MHGAMHSCCESKLCEQSSFEPYKPTSGFDGGCYMVDGGDKRSLLALFRRMFLRGPLPCLHPHHTLAHWKEGDREREREREMKLEPTWKTLHGIAA
ncbi:hypothetical protein CGRA01v4_02363 [Colletotrichum graminicola]|nr:hypothetical protein CGRA01v4_02363 [Colletotrichum graminicola]